MTRDLLQGTHARRLVRQPQGWTLEVECLVRRYGSVYRPSVRRIQGMEVILHHLQSVRAERLAEHARQLMVDMTPDGADERSFEPVNDEWIPSSLLKTDPPLLGNGDDPKVAEKLAALDRENKNLRARLAQIESMISSDVNDAEQSQAGSPSPMPRRLSAAPPANEQSSNTSPLAYQGTMVLPNGRPDLRKPIPLGPIDEPPGAAAADFNARPAVPYEEEEASGDAPVYGGDDPVEEAPVYGGDDPVEEAPVYGGDDPVEAAPVYGSDDPVEEAPVYGGDDPVEAAPVYGSDDPVEEAPVYGGDDQVEEAPVYGGDDPVEEAPVYDPNEGAEDEPSEPDAT